MSKTWVDRMMVVVVALALAVSAYGFETSKEAYDAGRAAERARKPADARAAYAEALKLAQTGEEKAQAIMGPAGMLNSAYKWAEAREEFLKVLAIEGATPTQLAVAQTRVGQSYYWQSQYPTAKEELAKVLAMKDVPDYIKAEAQTFIGHSFSREYNAPGAGEAYAKVLALAGASLNQKLDAQSYVMNSCMSAKDYPGTKTAAAKLLEMAATSPTHALRANAAIGQADFALKDYAAAKESFAKAVAIENGRPAERAEAQLNLARCCHLMGDMAAAKTEFEKVLAMAGASEDDQRLARLCLVQATPKGTPGRPLAVLFIGNSYTDANLMPQIVEYLAASAPEGQPRIVWDKATIGGSSLKRHWDIGENGGARGKIAAGGWDFVVLQEYGVSPSKEDFFEYAKKFDELIKSTGAQTVLQATGYHSNGFPKAFVQTYDRAIELAKEINARVAPGGMAWLKYLGETPTKEQVMATYHADKSHPGPSASYLYGCAVYSTLTGNSPVGLTAEWPKMGPKKFAADDIRKMQEAAWAACQETLAALKK